MFCTMHGSNVTVIVDHHKLLKMSARVLPHSVSTQLRMKHQHKSLANLWVVPLKLIIILYTVDSRESTHIHARARSRKLSLLSL